MTKFTELGKKLKRIRQSKNQSITGVAEAVGISRTHLSKIENGHERSSFNVLNNLFNHFHLSRDMAEELKRLSGHRSPIVMAAIKGKEEVDMTKAQINKEDMTKVKVNIKNVPVLYSDSVFVTSSPLGIVFDFAQRIGPTKDQDIVARIGMSREHASRLLSVLQKRLKDKGKSKTEKK